jgi:hypothetical protein
MSAFYAKANDSRLERVPGMAHITPGLMPAVPE